MPKSTQATIRASNVSSHLTADEQFTTINRKVPASRQDIVQDRVPTEKTQNLYTQYSASPSSSIAGFFQAPPRVLNQFYDDAALRRALSLFLPPLLLSTISPELSTFGDKVLSPQVLNWVLDAERNPPYVKTFDSWGRRRDELITSTGWQELQKLGIAEGMVAIPYENANAEYSRVHHFAKYALWCGSSAWVNCPSLMVDGVASLFRKYLSDPELSADQRPVLQSAYDRLTSRDLVYAWTTGQWMTERQGGSDVSMTETLATYSPDAQLSSESKAVDGNRLGPWLLSGFKWFSSATDANMTVLLAKTPSKGLSLFFAPMRKTLPSHDVLGNDTVLNGITIQRLKSKLGTRALPTAELELKGVRAYLIGEEGRGTKEIATVLNVARVHNGVTAIGFWGRGLGIVRAFTRVRVIGRRPLWERTGFMQTLAMMHVQYRADVLLNFFVAALLGVVEQEQFQAYTGGNLPNNRPRCGTVPGLTSQAQASYLLRLLTPALKGHCSKTAIAGLQECMECMGGVGYLENEDMQFNIARLYRDANVLPIWEGTTDMMADDSILRVLYRKQGDRDRILESFDMWIKHVLEQAHGGHKSHADIIRSWSKGFKNVILHADKAEAELKARTIMDRLVAIVQGALLIADAARDGDEVAALALESWFGDRVGKETLEVEGDWGKRAAANLKIVFGSGGSICGVDLRARL